MAVHQAPTDGENHPYYHRVFIDGTNFLFIEVKIGGKKVKEMEKLREVFFNVFGRGKYPVVTARAPGRVNLIGEHTDYNEGFVFPMAVDFWIYFAARQRDDYQVKIYSLDYGEQVVFSLYEPISFDDQCRWSNYLRGVFHILKTEGMELCGMEIAFCGNIPQGAGLSSSAALEVGTALVIQAVAGFSLDGPTLAELCQRAENEFVGMRCGIMDQFISIMGKRGHALFLDCRSLAYRHVPFELNDYRILICHSGVKHALVDSEYNRRRQECEEGVAFFARRFPGIKALRDVTCEQLEECRKELEPVIYQRCRHVITENDRVQKSVEALKQGDLPAFGELMNASHDSLRDRYEVSCAEIDFLVELARKVPGVLGARITGGGFGGSTVNLVVAGAVEDFSRRVLEKYRQQTGREGKLFISTAAGGAEII